MSWKLCLLATIQFRNIITVTSNHSDGYKLNRNCDKLKVLINVHKNHFQSNFSLRGLLNLKYN